MVTKMSSLNPYPMDARFATGNMKDIFNLEHLYIKQTITLNNAKSSLLEGILPVLQALFLAGK